MQSRFVRLVPVLVASLMGSPLARLAAAQTQAASAGANVYRAAAPAVFLVEVRDDTGAVASIGSAFLVKGGRLVTNAHVVRGGRAFLRTGAARLPLTVEKLDSQNDLAILHADAPLEATELELSASEPAIGSPVYALGNPKGLERSISEGLVSGIREVGDRRLLQISAAISPGSSGGPVVTRDGVVVGVAVGYLDQGQNLNFAVPAAQVMALLDRRATGGESSVGESSVSATLTEARRLLSVEAPDYRDTAASNHYYGAVAAVVRRAASLAHSGDEYLEVATVARAAAMNETVRYAEEAMRRGTRLPDSARVLMLDWWGLEPFALDTMSAAGLQYRRSIADMAIAHLPPRPELYEFRSRVFRRLKMGEKAVADAAMAVKLGENAPLLGWYWTVYHDTMHEFGSSTAESAVFRRMVAAKQAGPLDWADHASHLAASKEWSQAADAYVIAYGLRRAGGATFACKAGNLYYLADSTRLSLAALRSCVDEFATAPSVDTALVRSAHRLIAIQLNLRGVWPEAESHARQALALGEDAWAYNALARALLKQERPREAAAAAEAAIRVSDGANSSMHFTAGLAYVELQEWSRCVSAFKKAAELDPEESSAPYNMGLCLAKQGFFGDAARAMETVLRLDPKRENREDIESMIRRWRQ